MRDIVDASSKRDIAESKAFECKLYNFIYYIKNYILKIVFLDIYWLYISLIYK